MYGVPKRLRTDMVGENIDAWEYMIGHHGGNDNYVILGSSVHNVRIERMWRDVSRSVITPFKERFTSLKDQEILDVDNEIDLFCLHEVFAHRINASLNDFVSSWNSHPLTSENNYFVQEVTLNRLKVMMAPQLHAYSYPHHNQL